MQFHFVYFSYITLPFEIRTNRFLLMLYNRLSKLHIGSRDMSVKFPEEFIAYIDGKNCKNCQSMLSV